MTLQFSAQKSIVGSYVAKEKHAEDDPDKQFIESFYNQHSVKFQMSSNYTLDVFTLRNSENKSYMVRVMDSKKAPGKHVSYLDYVNKTNYSRKKQVDPNAESAQVNRYFEYVSRKSENACFVTHNRRVFGKRYENSLPAISIDNNLICMPRFSNALGQKKYAQEGIVDVYDCSKPDFWMSNKPVDTNDGFYRLSLKLTGNNHENFEKMQFSNTNKFLAVQCTDELYIYDLQLEQNNQNYLDGNTQRATASIYFSVAQMSYDRIVGLHIDEEDLQSSWVILQSTAYAQIHLLPLMDIMKSYNRQDTFSDSTNRANLGGTFIESSTGDSILFKIFSNEDPKFWSEICSRFSLNGKTAIVQTQMETYQLLLDPSDKQMYRKYFRIPMAPGIVGECFLRGEDKFFFCEHDKNLKYLQLRGLKLWETNDFSNTRISCHGTVEVKEIIEFERNGRQVLRVSAIRNSEGLLSWEIMDTAGGQVYLQSTNSSRLQTFRWPYFAYVEGDLGIVINPIADKEYTIHHQLKDLPGGSIQRIDCSAQGNLYVLVQQDKTETLFKMKIRKHLSMNELKEQYTLDRQVSKINFDQVYGDIRQIKEDEICQQIYQWQEEKAVKKFFIVEQKVGLDQLMTFLFLRGKELMIVTKSSTTDEPVKNIYQHGVQNIQMINTDNFMIHPEDSNNVRLLTVGYSGSEYFEDKLIFRENTFEIVKILADKDNFFVLCQNGNEFKLNCFILDQGLDLIPTGVIKDIHIKHPAFADEFLSSSMINANILICSQEKFVKIYHNEDEKIQPALQSFYNFLPVKNDLEKDRFMSVQNMRNCPVNNRLLMQFSYPSSCNPKEVLVIPYIDDNVIRMNAMIEGQIITWLSIKGVKKQKEDPNCSIESLDSLSQLSAKSEQAEETATRIFQYLPEQRLLKEFNLVGLLLQQSTYSKRFDDQTVLAIGSSKLRFLVTPEANQYLELLRIQEIRESHECHIWREINTKQLDVVIRGKTIPLFDVLCNFKHMLGCNFNFQFNNQNEVIIMCILPAGYMFTAYFIGSGESVYQIFASQAQQQEFYRFMEYEEKAGQSLSLSLSQEESQIKYELDETELQSVKKISQEFRTSRNFLISEHKIILWSRHSILHGMLKDMRENSGSRHLILRTSDFEIHTTINQSKKSANMLKRHKSIRESLEADEQVQNSEDSIEMIYSRNNTMKFQDEKGNEVEYEQVVLKVRHKENQMYLLQYVLDKSQEVTWLTGSKDIEVFYNSNQDFMAADPEMGVINLQTKEVLHEYHIQKHLDEDMDCYDLSWGNKMVQTGDSKFMILPNRLIMPYSLLNFIQHYQADSYDQGVENYYVEDYYKISGQTQLHKFMYKPILLESLLDSYWTQNKNFLTAVLVKQEIWSQQSFEPNYSKRQQENIAGLMAQGGQDREVWAQRIRQAAMSQVNHSAFSYQRSSLKDVLDAQMETNCDNIINKILYYLSQLPMQLSHNLMKSKMYKLCRYSRFYDYLDAWPQQTNQMKSIRMIYTSMEPGMHELPENCSYLKKSFFDQYPTEVPKVSPEEQVKQASQNRQKTYMLRQGDDDDFFRSESSVAVHPNESLNRSQKNEEEESDTEDDEEQEEKGKTLQQIDMKMLQVDWLIGSKEGRRMLGVMSQNTACLQLFDSQTVIIFTNYLWNTSYRFFVFYYFMPFVALGFFPLLVMSFMMYRIEDPTQQSSDFAIALFITVIVLFCFGTLVHIYVEVSEMRHHGYKVYLKNFSNYYQWAMIFVNSTLSYSIVYGMKYDSHDNIDKTRIHMMYSIILNLIELFNRVRIFKFFAYFVRQLNEIVEDAIPLGAMLGFIVVAQALLFWILDENSHEPAYLGPSGFFMCFIDSYRLSLGDFEIAESFIDNTDYIIMFWAVFFAGTLVSLLIILNMVIAVMGGTFERVAEQTESQIMRSKLELICSNYYRFPGSLKKRLSDIRYLLAVEVDPELDPIEKDSMEKRMGDRMARLESSMEHQAASMEEIKLNLISLYDKLTSTEISTKKKSSKRQKSKLFE